MLNRGFAKNLEGLKRVIRNRLGGDLYMQIQNLSMMERKVDKTDIVANTFLQKKKVLIAVFLFGSGIPNKIKESYDKSIYSSLCGRYTSKENDSLFNFNGTLLPKPTEIEDQLLFARESGDFLLYYLINDTALCDAVTREGPYEYKNVYLSPNDIVIDCGANMGMFSAIASHKQCICYAFEPSRHVIDTYLSKTASLNPNIHICEYALSDKREKVSFFTGSLLGSGSINNAKNENGQYEIVQAISLDVFVNENNLPRVDFIKADIEGAERYMLMGAKQVLKDFAPKIAICTYHLPDDPKVLRELILDANPNYVIEEKFKKMYAYVK